MGGNSDIGCAILNPSLMDNSTAFSTLGAFVFFIFLAVALSGTIPWAEIQNASLKNRLAYVANANVCICCCSMCFHFMHMLGGLLRADHGMLNKLSFFEYMFTCPFMMLAFVLLGGPKVEGAKYRVLVMYTTVLVLMFGFLASLVTNILMKATCFMFGVILFSVIIYVMNRTILEHSDGKESLFNGNSSTHATWYRALGKKIFLTWILFPIWWVLSPEGFALLTDSHDVDSMVKLLLNCLAKGLYVLYIRSLQSRFKDQSETLSVPASHSVQKDCHDKLESFGKYLDKQGEWRSSTMDIECGDMPAMVDCQPPSSEKKPSEPRRSSKSSASTCSTRSSSQEHIGVEELQPLPSLLVSPQNKKRNPEVKSFCAGTERIVKEELPSDSDSGKDVKSEDDDEDSNVRSSTKRQLEAQQSEEARRKAEEEEPQRKAAEAEVARKAEEEAERIADEEAKSDQIKLLWQQIQIIQSKMAMPQASQVSSQLPEPALSL